MKSTCSNFPSELDYNMIAFFADNHFKARPGYHLQQKLRLDEPLSFHEDDLSGLPAILSNPDCRLLILNWISDTSGNPHPGSEIEKPLRAYLEAGRPLLLLHGASAAFHLWEWWRAIVGLRWVRGDDPDGFPASTHPVRPYCVTPTRTRHPLASQLQPFDLTEDEIYIQLEQTCPLIPLMETRIDEGTFPQAYIAESPFGGPIAGFIPGHDPVAFESPELVGNIRTLIHYLTGNRRNS